MKNLFFIFDISQEQNGVVQVTSRRILMIWDDSTTQINAAEITICASLLSCQNKRNTE